MIMTLLICTALAAAATENILPNPSFEDVTDGTPAETASGVKPWSTWPVPGTPERIP